MTNPTNPTHGAEHGSWQLPPPMPRPPAEPQADPSMWTGPARPRRTKRVFMWVFLAIQALFLIWVISGAATAGGTPADCATSGLDLETCNAASDVGTGIGVAIIVGAWFFVDVFLGVGYAVYRLAKRPER